MALHCIQYGVITDHAITKPQLPLYDSVLSCSVIINKILFAANYFSSFIQLFIAIKLLKEILIIMDCNKLILVVYVWFAYSNIIWYMLCDCVKINWMWIWQIPTHLAENIQIS